MLVLSKEDVASRLNMPDAIGAVRQAFTALGQGEVTMPQRLATPIAEQDATHLSMPCYVAGEKPILTVKVVTFFPHSPQTTHALIVVHDAATGEPLCVMDGELLTAMRTGAVSGLATQLLSRPQSSFLGIFGTGEVAYWQIAAVCSVRKISRVFVTARDPAKGARFCDRVRRDQDVECVYEADASSLVNQSDVLCLATTSTEPVLFGRDVRGGTHVNGVGSFRPDMVETDVEFVKRARVVVDQTIAANIGAGELIAAAHQHQFDWSQTTELSQLLLNTVPGRTENEITFFKSVGLAVQDAFCAQLVYQMSL